jgi:hypothetical protein
MLALGSRKWTLAKAYSTSNGFVWVRGTSKGVYHLSIRAKDSGSSGNAGNSLGRWDV